MDSDVADCGHMVLGFIFYKVYRTENIKQIMDLLFSHSHDGKE